jgi:putative inorganic carbon (HCO3(-)) transporter
VLSALVIGIAIALMPADLAFVVLVIVILSVFSLIDLRSALLITLTIAPFKALIETESRLVLPLDVGQLLFLGILAIWMARSIAVRRSLGFVWTPVFVPIVLFTLTASLSLWTAISPGATINELLKWVEILAMCALVMSLLAEKPRRNLFVVTGILLLSAVIQMGIGLYQFLGGSGAAHLWILDYRYFRAFGSFGQPNPFGAFMGLMLPIAIGAAAGAIWEVWQKYRRSTSQAASGMGEWATRAALFAAAATIIGVGLVISWSRGAWVGFGAAMLAGLLFAPRRRLIGIGLVGLLLVGGVVAVSAGVIPASLAARFSDFTQDLAGFDDVRGKVISDENYAILERFAHWQAALSMANDSPWLGVGFGNYEVAYPRYELMNWPFALGHAHNYYLNLLSETGVVGLSGYLIAWMMIFGLILRALLRQTGFGRGLALGLLGACVHLTIHSLFDKLYVNNLFLHIGVMLGLIGGLLSLELSAKLSVGRNAIDHVRIHVSELTVSQRIKS